MDPERDKLRAWRLAAYEDLRRQRPDLFENPPDAAFEIVTDPDVQLRVAEQSAGWNRSTGVPEQYADLGIVYQDPYVTLIKDAVRFRSGHVGPYIRSMPTPATVTAGAGALPVHQQRVVLVRHFRHASRQWHWEIPRGFGNAGEDPADTARRELEEELNVQVLRLVRLGTILMEGGVSRDLPVIFWAEVSAPGTLEAEEGIDEIRLVDAADLDQMIRSGDLADAFTLTAVAQARARGLLSS